MANESAAGLPELTRSLRGLGSRRAGPGAEHDRFFEPLLDARRIAERAADRESVVAAFSGAALRARLSRRMSDFAAERYPGDPPERRALEAELLECAEPFFGSLDGLAPLERAVCMGADSEKADAWQAWTVALRRAFERADECWLTLRLVLVDSRREPPRRRRGWRRRT